MKRSDTDNIFINVTKVMMLYLILFLILISFIANFKLFKSQKWVESSYNKRAEIKRNEVLRGSILDRNGEVLAFSQREGDSQIRTYTKNEVFAPLIGYVDPTYDVAGLEKSLDSRLSTMPVSSTVKNMFGVDKSEKKGNDITLTLDSRLQDFAYNIFGDRKGAVVVLNCKTGEILADVSKPSYDVSNLDSIWNQIVNDENSPLLDRGINGLYAPGSTFKIITLSCALTNLPDVLSETFEDNGVIQFPDGNSLPNAGWVAHGNIDLQTAFDVSSNVVFGSLGIRLGGEKLKQEAELFNYNKVIRSDDLDVSKAKFPSLNDEEEGKVAQSAIGQGEVVVSPLQIALTASTIANNGNMPQVQIVKGNNPGFSQRVISEDIAQQVKDMMRDVMINGTGSGMDIYGIGICGKTGTAEVEDSNGKYVNSLFAGFSSYDDPKYAIAVVVEHGESGIATYIASEVLNKAMNLAQ
ncbi:MAG: penicillin-binding protein 2 [Oscillospiraceae bacterium]|nr:penicillin-binding protein 2 [Oscillospiraceae bacterium]